MIKVPGHCTLGHFLETIMRTVGHSYEYKHMQISLRLSLPWRLHWAWLGALIYLALSIKFVYMITWKQEKEILFLPLIYYFLAPILSECFSIPIDFLSVEPTHNVTLIYNSLHIKYTIELLSYIALHANVRYSAHIMIE